MLRGHIDVHQHVVVPPRCAAWLGTRGLRDAGVREVPPWAAAAALATGGHAAIDHGNATALFPRFAARGVPSKEIP